MHKYNVPERHSIYYIYAIFEKDLKYNIPMSLIPVYHVSDLCLPCLPSIPVFYFERT